MNRFLITLILCLSFSFSFAQKDTTQAPYLRFPTVPPFQVLLSDSSTMFTKAQLPKKKAVLFMIFSPECSHCQHETEELVAHKDDFRDIEIVMITMHPMDKMREFITRYQLNDLSNVVVGRDIYYIMSSFYSFHNMPYLAMYDKKGNLISTFEGSLGMDKVLEIFRENK